MFCFRERLLVETNTEILTGSYGKLPAAPSREWREADLNYNGGYRGTDRILYSNDQLIFVSKDHYKTFYELID